MLRKSLSIVALLALAAPAAAQEELVWSSKRPDAQAPAGLLGGRTLEQGELEITYRFGQLNSVGMWYEDGPLSFQEVAAYYDAVPQSLRDRTHALGVAFGATPELTLAAQMSFSQRRREHLTAAADAFYVLEASEPGDLEMWGMYRIWEQGPYRAHVQLGARVPTGTTDVQGETPFSTPRQEPLPYDMRPGAGVFGVLPGLTVLAQNESGTVGAQLKGTIFVGTNDRDYAPGERMEFNVWGAARVNDYFSFSARAAYQIWAELNGADPRLDPFRDPGNDGLFAAGSRLDIPLGVNFYMPADTRLAGHRLSLEYIHPVTHSYDNLQFGADWGLVASWQVVF